MAPWRWPLGLLFGITLLIIWSAWQPADSRIWWAEITPVLLFLGALAATARRFRFSNTAYTLMACWLVMHTIGAHYTFAHVPFDWFNNLIGSERNQYDRVAHFSIGFYAWPVAELLVRRGICGRWLAVTVGLALIMAMAAGYEIIEWLFVVAEGGNAGIEFLGAQGDQWDAQKDMLADTLGAVLVLIGFCLFYPQGQKDPTT